MINSKNGLIKVKIEDFKIGEYFHTAAATYLCTDIGTRIITAIRVPDAEYEKKEFQDKELWMKGPPYILPEEVFDEEKMEGCYTSTEKYIQESFDRSLTSAHPGYLMEDLMKMEVFTPNEGLRARLKSQSGYIQQYLTNLFRFERVKNKEVYHPYVWVDNLNDKNNKYDCKIKAFGLFTREFIEIPLEEWIQLPISNEDDLIEAKKIYKKDK